MKLVEKLPKNIGLMALAFSLAIVFWGFVHYYKESEAEFNVPVTVSNCPPGLAIANEPPGQLNVRIAGPQIQMRRMNPEKLVVRLDLENVAEGTVAFPDLEKAVPVPRDLRVTRIYPSVVEVRLVRSTEPNHRP